MEIKQYQLPGFIEGDSIKLSDAVFDVAYNQGLVWQVVNAYLAGGRTGNKANKSRSEVRGGGAKPWRQKGTGRARIGSIRNPSRVHGSKAFGPKPHGYNKKVQEFLAKQQCPLMEIESYPLIY